MTRSVACACPAPAIACSHATRSLRAPTPLAAPLLGNEKLSEHPDLPTPRSRGYNRSAISNERRLAAEPRSPLQEELHVAKGGHRRRLQRRLRLVPDRPVERQRPQSRRSGRSGSSIGPGRHASSATARSRRRRGRSGRWCSSTRRRRGRRASAAISSAVPSRPIGWRSTKAWRISSTGLPVVLRQRLDPAVERRRLDGAGADRVGADALADEVGRDRLGQADHRRLRGAIGVAVGDAAHRRGAGRDVDDRALAALQHARQEGADRAVHRLGVDVEGEVPVVVAWWSAPCRDGRSRRS